MKNTDYDLQSDENLIAETNKGNLLLTDKHLYLRHNGNSVSIELDDITLLEIETKRQLAVLLPGFVFAPLLLFYQSAKGHKINGFTSAVVAILVLGSLLRYYLFPERVLLVNTADKSTRYLLRGSNITEVEKFVEQVKEQANGSR